MKKLLLLLVLILTVSYINPINTIAQPAVSNIIGTATHGSNITISGSSFGLKSPAAPKLWQDFEDKSLGSNPLPIDGWLDNSRRLKWSVDNDKKSILPPHAKSTKYLIGEHIDNDTNISLIYTAGAIQNVWVVYAYRRFDPTAPTTDESYCTNQEEQSVAINYKEWWFQHFCGDNDTTAWYHSSDSVITSNTNASYSSAIRSPNDLCGGGQINDVNFGANPSLAWGHKEWIMRQNPGFVRIINYDANGVRTLHAERTCAGNLIDGSDMCPSHPTEPTRNICSIDFGAFTRWCGSGSAPDEFPADGFYRYLDDVYIDNTFSRVLLCNNASYNSATICEPQIPSSWSESSIQVEVNQGALPDGTAYLYVFDSNNSVNATGYPVTLGEEAPTISTAKDWFVSKEVGSTVGPNVGDVPFNNSYMCNIMHLKKSGSAWAPQRRLFRGGQHGAVIDGTNKLHMVYQNRNTGELFYAYKGVSDVTWTYEKMAITTHERNFDDISYSDLVIDSSGAVHIIYYQNLYEHDVDQAIKYATNRTGVWVIQTIEEVGDYTESTNYTMGIDIDSSDTVHVSYYQKEVWDGYNYTTSNRLRYAYKTLVGSWVKSTIESGTSVGIYSDIKVDDDGYVHIAYYYAPTNRLAYAGNSSGSFVIRKETVAGGSWPSIDLDSGFNSFISHYDSVAQDLRVSVTVADASISGTTIETTGSVGQNSSIKLYPNTTGSAGVHVVYYDATNKAYKYKYRSGAGVWATATTVINANTITAATVTNRNTQLNVDSSGTLHATIAMQNSRSSPFVTPTDLETYGLNNSAISSGDTIYFRANELYEPENLVIGIDNLTLDAYEDGNLPTLTSNSGQVVLTVQNTVNTITIKNLHFRCYGTYGLNIIGDGSTVVNLENCVFEAAASPTTAFPLLYGSNATINIDNCYFYRKRLAATGVDWNTDTFIRTLSSRTVIKNSEFFNPSTHAIYLDRPASGTIIEHNYINGRFKSSTISGLSPSTPNSVGWHQGVTVTGSGSQAYAIIRNNIIDMMDAEAGSTDYSRGIFVTNASAGSAIQVLNNLIIGKGTGIGVYTDVSSSIIANNIFYRLRRSLYTYNSPSGVIFRNNCEYNSYLDKSISGVVTQVNNITTNPLLRWNRFRSPVNDSGVDITLEYHEKYYKYRPRPNSTLRLAGYSGVSLAETDMIGNPVNQSVPSIGPIEVTTNTRLNIDSNHKLTDLPQRYDEIPNSIWAKGYMGVVPPSLYGINIWPSNAVWGWDNNGAQPTTKEEHLALMLNGEDHYEILVNDLGATSIRYPGGLLSNRLNLLHTVGDFPRMRSRLVGRSGPAYPGSYCPIAITAGNLTSFCSQTALYPESTKAIVIGDSLMQMNANICKNVSGWLNVALQEQIRDYAVGGACISGGTVTTIPDQYEDAYLEDSNFDIVIMDGGGNDMIDDCPCAELDDSPIPCPSVVGTVILELEAFIDHVIDDHHKKVLYVGTYDAQDGALDEPRCGLPISAWQDVNVYIREAIQSYCATKENCHYVDTQPAFNGPVLRDDCLNTVNGAYCWPEYYYIGGVDGLHPSTYGTRALAEEILKDSWFNMLTAGDFDDRLPWTVMDYSCGAYCDTNSKYYPSLDDLGGFMEEFNVTGAITIPFCSIDDGTPYPCETGYLSHEKGTGLLSSYYLWKYANAIAGAGDIVEYMCDEYTIDRDNYGFWRGEIGWNLYAQDGHRGPYVLNESVYPYSLGAFKYMQLGNERCETGLSEDDLLCILCPSCCEGLVGLKTTMGNETDINTFGMDDLIEDFGTAIKTADSGSVCDDTNVMFYHCRNPIFTRTESPTTAAVNTRIEEISNLSAVSQYWDLDTFHPYQQMGGNDEYAQGFPLPYLGDKVSTYFLVPTTGSYKLELFGTPSELIGNTYSVRIYIDDVLRNSASFPYVLDITSEIETLGIPLTRGMHKLTIENISTATGVSIGFHAYLYRESDNMFTIIDFKGSPDIWEIFSDSHYLEDLTMATWNSLPTPNTAGPSIKRIGFTEWSTGHGNTAIEQNFQNRSAHFISTADSLRIFAKWQVETANIWGPEMENYNMIDGAFSDSYYRTQGKDTNWTSTSPYYQKYQSKALGFKITAKHMRGTLVNSYVVNPPIFYLDKGTVDPKLGMHPRTSYINFMITSLVTKPSSTELNIQLINKSSDPQTVALNINDFTVSSYQIIVASTAALDSGNTEQQCYTGYRNPSNTDEYLSCTSYEVGSVVSGSISQITLDPLSVTVIKCTGN